MGNIPDISTMIEGWGGGETYLAWLVNLPWYAGTKSATSDCSPTLWLVKQLMHFLNCKFVLFGLYFLEACYQWPVLLTTKEVNSRLAKRPLVFNGCLANRRLTSLVKEATGIQVSQHWFRQWLGTKSFNIAGIYYEVSLSLLDARITKI